MLTVMARSTIRFLKQQGQFNTHIASLVGCDRHTVARVLTEPTDPPRQRQRASTLETRRAALVSWIAEEIPTTRMLELARQDPAAPYAGGASTFYRFVAKLRAEGEAGAATVIRFEGLPGEYVQWDWGEARVRLGGSLIKRVFLAGRLKYSRVSAIRWRAQMDLETLLRGDSQHYHPPAARSPRPWAPSPQHKIATLGRWPPRGAAATDGGGGRRGHSGRPARRQGDGAIRYSGLRPQPTAGLGRAENRSGMRSIQNVSGSVKHSVLRALDLRRGSCQQMCKSGSISV